MPKYRVLISEVITNEAVIEMEAENEEEINTRIYEHDDYDPDVLQPRTVEVFVGYIKEIKG